LRKNRLDLQLLQWTPI